MLCYRLGTVNDFHWGFKPVFRYSKPHTYSTFIGEEKEKVDLSINTMYLVHIKHEQKSKRKGHLKRGKDNFLAKMFPVYNLIINLFII